ncbi:hypothetical protein L596_023125 [Steinernema carpocapsae]|uniref:Uncharacterized protein n=1 Tax=Steinernema carpocapsae TaxID=34508 RepID=A0A4U5MCQ6_STECR|nr:hypothetical protein L596_023125 [Steinernema carpocapsae]
MGHPSDHSSGRFDLPSASDLGKRSRTRSGREDNRQSDVAERRPLLPDPPQVLYLHDDRPGQYLLRHRIPFLVLDDLRCKSARGDAREDIGRGEGRRQREERIVLWRNPGRRRNRRSHHRSGIILAVEGRQALLPEVREIRHVHLRLGISGGRAVLLRGHQRDRKSSGPGLDRALHRNHVFVLQLGR